jgi:hypothetical protein
MGKLMPYQQRFPDGYIINAFRKKPKAKVGIIYTVLEEDHELINGDVFIPSWDGTDHLHFVCANCKGVADILQVHFETDYGGDIKYALFFWLGCRKCGATGQRKLYLDRRADACEFQRVYDDEGNVYVYREAEEPYQIITFEQKIAAFLKRLKDVKKAATIDEALKLLEEKNEAERK